MFLTDALLHADLYDDERGPGMTGRGLHSLTSQLNLSAIYETGGARRNCVAHVKGVLGGIFRVHVGCVGLFCVSDTAQVELRSGRV